MAKGAIAKQEVIERIAAAFGEDFVGEVDKKVYVWSEENGERIQVALALTCPKAPVQTGNSIPTTDNGDWDFSGDVVTSPTPVEKAEITPEEKAKVADLMSRLGL